MTRPPGVEGEQRNRALLSASLAAMPEPQHSGWFSCPLAAMDLSLALALMPTAGALPVTEAARDVYRQMARDGRTTQDITAVVEYGRMRLG